MEIQLLCIGKTDRSFWAEALEMYEKRLQHYVKFSIRYLADVKTSKKSDPSKIKLEETKLLLEKIKPGDMVILLDEKGKMFNSAEFSKEIENQMNSGKKKVLFVIGGAYGFSEELYQKFPERMALSKMTFSHQMVRLFFCEQLYRAYTIINNHPYHNA
ncbi:23S rRNA (pseudouridine(1915)-N(3))-methyltransferase RlmH [Flavobacteriaceae bacterium]|jgi:23S rRNA (pseudouridine1915-N3)-methyltransferase|nr:23S rRNA (pseudouridine(1915)-N(3))-methyltransferase RlmH [Flavobacteriaceae bacterium]MDA8643776.1 23S rRNA (pseudouridine(1915)-N(3))-methyltransferase RlmH [Flavobacteriaceae bacterium]MDA9037588.1 23S rRNA (pseudouridine(1915)-N(3))-methyltransferase RlmH [Flavobacteriaceae bacterium]MDA9587978.1 23S rRNA (pseudouridine(1915)-N(3))-methyltransferase RlmH [Flavobacteriaceae bacterium]MDA9851493.1 23S rRNA (pseudouridine(1915)-N(3))-methyltransferase RlmH [Flavobacteriaceae bacterium]